MDCIEIKNELIFIQLNGHENQLYGFSFLPVYSADLNYPDKTNKT